MIAIVDYQAGNLASVKKAFDHLGQQSEMTSEPNAIASADKIVLPGVGNFGATIALAGPIEESINYAIKREIPLLGICLGMQWLFESSQEAPDLHGLGIFEGQCEKFPVEVKSPHVGWNQLQFRGTSRLLRHLPADAFVYFTHSYRAPLIDATVAGCTYGGIFSAAVERGQLFGVQFHPEKSGTAGRQILQTFCEL